MKRIAFLLLLILSTSIFAQKQIGYVRTIQKANKPAVYLKGVEIITKENKNGTKSGDGGYYEIPVGVVNGKKGYTITSVKKAGYNLVDEKELFVFQKYNVSPKDIVLISKSEEEKQTKFLENKLRENIEKEYLKKMAEVKGNAKKVEDVENMYKKQLENIPEAVKKLVYLDYKNLTDSLDIAIAEAYENADFAKAVELINKKPSLKERSKQNKQLKEAIEKEKEAIIRESYIKILYFWTKYEKDSTIFYVKLISEQEIDNKHYVYYDLASVYESYGDLDSALFYFNKAKEIGEYVGNDADFIASVCDRIGYVYYWQNKYDKALECYNKSLKLFLDIYGEDTLFAARIYNQMGSVFSDRGQYDTACAYYNRALKIWQQNYGENHPDYALSLSCLGSIAFEKGDYKNALYFFKRAVSVYESVYGEISLSVADTYNRIGKVCFYFEQLDTAIVYYKKALDIVNAICGDKHLQAAYCYTNIGEYYSFKGQFDNALFYFEKALSICLDVYGEKHSSISAAYHNLGSEYIKMRQYDKALDYLNKALTIGLSIYGEKHPNVARDYRSIGRVYYLNGMYAEALEYNKKSLEIFLSIYGDNHPEVGSSYSDIGSIYSSQGQNDKALDYYNKALKNAVSNFGMTNSNVATSYSCLGYVYMEQGLYDRALMVYKKALGIRLSIFGDVHEMVGTSYNAIGEAYLYIGNLDSALRAYNKAKDIWLSLYGENHPFTATSYFNIGYIYIILGDFEKAKENYSKDLDILRYLYGDNNSDVVYIKGEIERFEYELSIQNNKVINYIQTHCITLKVLNDSPARQKGMSGEYVLLEFGDWTQDTPTSVFRKNQELKEKSKTVVVLQNGVVQQYYFNGSIGAQIGVKEISKKEKQEIDKVYNAWKKKSE